jgi:hypothetical protein
VQGRLGCQAGAASAGIGVILVRMKHATFADETLFLDDEATDGLVEYASVSGATNTADTVRLRAVSTLSVMLPTGHSIDITNDGDQHVDWDLA